jgi:hypothetical protein
MSVEPMHVAESTMINRGIPQKHYRTASRDSLFPATVDQSISSNAPPLSGYPS